METRYKIGEFAKMLCVKPKTLQNWDRTGKLKAFRTIGNQRYYTDEHLEKIKEMEQEKAAAIEKKRLERQKEMELIE